MPRSVSDLISKDLAKLHYYDLASKLDIVLGSTYMCLQFANPPKYVHLHYLATTCNSSTLVLCYSLDG